MQHGQESGWLHYAEQLHEFGGWSWEDVDCQDVDCQGLVPDSGRYEQVPEEPEDWKKVEALTEARLRTVMVSIYFN